MTSDNFPTPEGSIITRSGAYFSNTSFNAVLKSPTNEQQIHPEFISVISTPASFRNPPSIPISPNSFSINTNFSFWNPSCNNFLIKVVLPAPKKPEIMSIFVIFSIFLSNSILLYILYYRKTYRYPHLLYVPLYLSLPNISSRTLPTHISHGNSSAGGCPVTAHSKLTHANYCEPHLIYTFIHPCTAMCARPT